MGSKGREDPLRKRGEDLSMRIHNYPECGLVLDRDHMYAMVIAGIEACQSNPNRETMKQEAPSEREGQFTKKSNQDIIMQVTFSIGETQSSAEEEEAQYWKPIWDAISRKTTS